MMLSSERPYQCNECDQFFSSKRSMLRHVDIIHNGEKRYECEYCCKLFTTSSNLYKHLRVHTGEKPYQCNRCDKAFSQSSTLKLHLRIHSGEKPFKCSYCEKSFSLKGYLSTHMKTHMKEYESADNTNLIKDVDSDTELGEETKDNNVHRPEEDEEFVPSSSPVLNFKCTKCDYKCVTKFLLVRHMRKHTGEKPFECPECDYKSAYRSNMDVHIKNLHKWLKRHKNKKGRPKKDSQSEKSFVCPDCPYRSSYKSSLASHIKNHHQWVEHENRQIIKTEPILKKYPLRKKYSCIECNTNFHSKDLLEDHMLTHIVHVAPEEANGAEFSEGNNSVDFSQKHEYLHVNNELENDEFECSMCDFICSSEKDIQAHSLICENISDIASGTEIS